MSAKQASVYCIWKIGIKEAKYGESKNQKKINLSEMKPDHGFVSVVASDFVGPGFAVLVLRMLFVDIFGWKCRLLVSKPLVDLRLWRKFDWNRC